MIVRNWQPDVSLARAKIGYSTVPKAVTHVQTNNLVFRRGIPSNEFAAGFVYVVDY